MKRIVSLLVLVPALSLALFGCGKSDDAAENDADASANAQTEDTAIDAETAAKLQELVDASQALMDAQIGDDDMVGLKLSMRGESMVYTNTYKQELVDMEGLEEELAIGTEAQSATFENLIDVLKAPPYNLKSPTVIVEYFTVDGEMIYSTEFTGK
jgi:hypothetical protein